jgi:adenylate cyclase
MAEEGFKRKLAAILSADVEGYSRLMDDDEEATVRTLTAYRTAITDLVQQYRGRVVDSPGDNILAEFASVVDAVNCAVEIQRDLAERNAELAYNRQMQFRIGVNLGDVIDQDGRIYGDGVNIAARVESLAEAGGICISGRAHDQVENKLGLEYEDLGKHEVKNISRPIQVYRVLSYPGAAAHRVVQAKETLGRKWRKIVISAAVVVVVVLGIWQFYTHRLAVETASVEKMRFPLPEKPSIAVLPFVNMSGDPEQEYFSDGITENIIAALSKVHNLFVIARNSTFTYKGKAVKTQQVAEELGVRYVLEGSVQMTEDRVRITAQLIDAINGSHLWAERYDNDLTETFALQDEITKKIITSLHVKLTMGDDARIFGQSTNNFEAYLKFLEANKLYLRHNKDTNILARQMFEEVITLDPNYVMAYDNLAWTYLVEAAFGWTESPAKSLEMAKEIAQKGISLDHLNPGLLAALSSVYIQKGDLVKGIALRKKAVSLAPNSANNRALLGIGLLHMGGAAEEAIKEFKIANRLDPFPPPWIQHYLGAAYRVNGEYQKAIEVFKKVIKKSPDYWISYLDLAICYGLIGHEKEARKAAAEALRIDPNLSIAKITKNMIFYRDKADKERTFEVLRKAGLPE